MSQDNPKHVACKACLHNELAKESKMTFEEIVTALSDIQDELSVRGWEEPAQLLHRALNRLTAIKLTESLARRLADKKNAA